MHTEPNNQNPDHLKQLHEALMDGSHQEASSLLEAMHPSAIADALETLPRDLRTDLWQLVATPSKGEVLLEIHGEVRQQLIKVSEEQELLTALAKLDIDELADLDADLPISVVNAMVEAMDPHRRQRYETVRFYPDDTAGGLMDVDAAAVRMDVSLKAVLRYLRKLRKQRGSLPEHLDSLMVVDRENKYIGILRLSDIVSLGSKKTVSETMTAGVPPIPVLTPATKVARLFEDQDLISAPVVSQTGRLLGRITIDDVVDVMRDEAEHEMMSRAGLSKSTDMFAPIIPSVGKRAIWLGVNLINAFIAAWVIGLFEDSIDKIVTLAVLMPVVASMGGVAGSQTLTLVTRGIALEQIRYNNAWRLFFRELAMGLLNGFLWALVVAIITFYWFNSAQLGIIFGVALALNLLTGAIAGTLIPLILHRLSIDPALAGGVILIAATDVIGFLSFLGLATLFLL